MSAPDHFCPHCGVHYDLHDGPDTCDGAESKARTLDLFFGAVTKEER